MNREQAIKVLEEYQVWRRYDGDIFSPDRPAMPHPLTVGEAIDYAIKILKENDKEGNR